MKTPFLPSLVSTLALICSPLAGQAATTVFDTFGPGDTYHISSQVVSDFAGWRRLTA